MYPAAMSPEESVLEQQRRLLASVENMERLIRTGRAQECCALVKDFATDLAAATDAPILIHLHARFERIRARVDGLGRTLPEAQPRQVHGNDTTYDPLAQYRQNLGKAVSAPDLNEGLGFVPETAHVWWRCSRDPSHPAWKATAAQTVRGRPCPACMSEAGLGSNTWYPTDTAPVGPDPHYQAMRNAGAGALRRNGRRRHGH